jgi:glycerol kinase
MKVILSLDQGTTGSTAALINAETLEFIGKANFEFPQIFPNSGWVEHNLHEIWESMEKAIEKALKDSNVSGNQIVGVGITNQRETTCSFRKNGEPLANAIVWQDRRTSDWCQSRKDKEEFINEKTGLPLDPYFSGSKMNWLLTNNDNVKKAAESDDLLFGTIDTYLIYKLSNQTSHTTDTTNASRTLLMNLKDLKWDDELLSFFEVNKNFLPEIKDSFGKFGTVQGHSVIPDGTPIHGVLGDQQAALYGQACFNKGEMKCTYGTGAFLVANTGNEIVRSKAGLLSTVAYSENGKATYALEGSSYIAGAAVQWLRDNLKFFESSPEVEEFANKADRGRCEDLFLLPFFSGIGSPYWEPNAKAALIGMDRGTDRNEISLACLEGIALTISDITKAIEQDMGESIASLRVDGGAVQNNLLMQIQANFSKTKIMRPTVIETTAYGAALACIKGLGLLDESKITEKWSLNKDWNPESDLSYYETKRDKYTSYIKSNFVS